MRLTVCSWLATTLLIFGVGGVALAHDATFPIEATKLKINAKGKKKDRSVEFKASGDSVIRIANHDPAADGASLVLSGIGGKQEGSSGLIRLPSENWKTITNKSGELSGYRYKDKQGSQGGINKVILKNRKLQVKGGGKNWTWKPGGKHDVVWAFFYLEDELYCAGFAGDSGTKVSENKKGLFKAGAASRPGACPEQLCGNARVELGEECDDGNLDDTDGCNSDCSIGICEGADYDSTYEAIQNVIFDSPEYGCTNGLCHDSASPAGDLDLTAANSYDQLVEIDADRIDGKRVRINEPEESFLYEKLAAKVEQRTTDGSPMPIGPGTLSEEHLRGVRNWIRGGAPRDLVVDGTQADLGTCLPPPDPLKIPVPDPPAAGEGIQLQATPWPLGKESEGEICMSTYYDLSSIVPESAKIPCPAQYAQAKICSLDLNISCNVDGDCPRGFCATRSMLNEGDECFALNRMALLQDPQSHHAIQYIYAGYYGLSQEEDGLPGFERRWGDWTYKFEDASDPRNGQLCDPREIDPALGYNPGCSGSIQPAVACIDYGPPDYSNVQALFGVDGAAVSLNVAQEPIKDIALPDDVYEVMPVKGLFTWNSHAFNLTSKDTTLAAYMNIYFAEEEEQQHALENIFDAGSIFVQDVPPFETEEYCRTWTAPKGANVFRLSSHTHRLGTLFRVWDPPNTPCVPQCPASAVFCPPAGGFPRCDGPRDDTAIYYSTLYSDPVQLYFDPPVVEDEQSVADRTYLYCAFYDNGSTPTSPRVKQASLSPPPPPGIGQFLGGPCDDEELACMAGPNKGKKCFSRAAGFCDTAEGAEDGQCDACPAQGGVTTEDEMFILFGDYYCPGGC